ncbi:MAG: LacI family DNA-binding transcriptional regulator [Victivallales bacterium]|nr:LacI family DNA-binding transcriptional regulator [Victivallales bacterium]
MSISFLTAGNDDNIVEQLKNASYAGVLLNNSYYKGDEKDLAILKKLNIPILIPHARADDYNATGFAVINSDEKKAWSDGIELLLSKGHSRIATLGTLSHGAKEKIRGFTEFEYLRFLRERGVDDGESLLKYVRYDSCEVHSAVSDIMQTLNPPTAIICYSDNFALEVYKSLNALGLKIPNDVAVMGYCGYPGDELLSPPLSTVDLQYSKIGRLAAEVLWKADEWFGMEDVAAPRIVSQHMLVERESTAIRRMEKRLVNFNNCLLSVSRSF